MVDCIGPIEKSGLERVSPNDEIKHVRYGKCLLVDMPN